ncbi:unnamed protein product [Durusdinium trenchii]|uniref:Uncharacterized protein n=2 Tax=Durusdinium trenchii TaxID=1381693 RepID=A0ABP0I7Q8_9DINO
MQAWGGVFALGSPQQRPGHPGRGGALHHGGDWRRGEAPHTAARHAVRAGPFAAAAAAALGARGRRAAPATEDPVFRWLAKVLRGRWAGEVLDAGTGPDSLQWLATAGREAESLTAVTACEGMFATLEDESCDFLDSARDQVLLGNWKDKDFLWGKSYDLVLADYLLGAVDHFAPFFQVGLLKRLAELTKPSGLLVLVGKEPEELRSSDEISQLALDVENFRDAVMILGRQRPYREMPRSWCSQQLWSLNFELVKGRVFPRRLTTAKVMRNLDWAEEELERVENELRQDLQRHLGLLRQRVESSQLEGHSFGQDYALVLQKRGP